MEDTVNLKVNRRHILAGGTASAVSVAMPWVARADAGLQTLHCGTSTPGITVVFFDYVRDNKLDAKYGFKLEAPRLIPSIGTLMAEFVSGSLDITTSVFDSWAQRFLAGVPIKLICGLTTADQIGIITPGDGPKSLAELRGKTIAAPRSSGIYQQTRAIVKEVAGIDIETEATVQNAENPAQGVTLVLANRADAAVAWEPMISSAIARRPDIRLLADVGQLYRERYKLDLPMFTLGARREIVESRPDVGKRLLGMYKDCIEGIDKNFDDVANKYAARMRIDAKVTLAAKASGRLRFKYVSAGEESGRNLYRKAFEFLVRAETLPKVPNDDIFIGA